MARHVHFGVLDVARIWGYITAVAEELLAPRIIQVPLLAVYRRRGGPRVGRKSTIPECGSARVAPVTTRSPKAACGEVKQAGQRHMAE